MTAPLVFLAGMLVGAFLLALSHRIEDLRVIRESADWAAGQQEPWWERPF